MTWTMTNVIDSMTVEDIFGKKFGEENSHCKDISDDDLICKVSSTLLGKTWPKFTLGLTMGCSPVHVLLFCDDCKTEK